MSIQELKQARQIIQDNYNLTPADCARVVGYINTNNADIIQDILSGDCSGVPSVLSALDIQAAAPVIGSADNAHRDPAEKTRKRSAADTTDTDNIQAVSSPVKSPVNASGMMGDNFTDDIIKDHTSQNKAVSIIENFDTRNENNADILPAVDGDIIPASNSDLLPPALPSMVDEWLFEFSQKYNIDLQKCAGLQWRAACLFIGQHIQAADILTDKTRPYKVYNPNRVAALIPLYEALTATYKHIALASDFIAFSGVSREWFYDSQKRGLTSACVDIRKKLQAIEESSLSAGLVDSRENPTGRIYYSKARLGWQETAPAVAAPVAVVVAVGDLPSLMDKKQ